jgi:hypothetical protein
MKKNIQDNVMLVEGDTVNGQQLMVVKSAGRLEQLNDLQLQHMEKVKQFWLNYIFSCRNGIDRNKAISGIEWLYKLAGYEKPIIVFLDSPMACQYGVNFLKIILKGNAEGIKNLAQVRAQVRAQVWAQVGAQVRAQVRAQVGAQVGDQVGAQVWDQVWAQVRAQVRAQVWDQVGAQVGDQVGAQVRAQVRAQVGDQVRAQVWDQVGAQVGDHEKLSYESFSSYANIGDLGWISFYDFFTQIGVINHKDFNELKELMLSGIYDMIQLNGFCIVSELPKKILRNNLNRLHSLEESAIDFKDGYSQHYINGVFVTPELFDALLNKRYTLENFIAEKNEETKAACLFYMREKWGEDYLVSFFSDHLKEVDTYVDKKDERYLAGTIGGMNIGVYTLFKGNLNGIKLAYIRCYCPSSDRMFYLGVDPAQKNAKDAIASLYRIPSCLKAYIKEIRRQGERFSTTLTDKGNDILKTMSQADAENLVAIGGEEYFSKMTYEY